MFQYEVWPQSAPDTLYTVMVIFTLKRWKLSDKILQYAFLLFVGCVADVQCVCAGMVAILHTEHL